MPLEKAKEKIVNYRIVNVKYLNYFENNFHDYEISNIFTKDTKIELSTTPEFDLPKGIVSIGLKVVVSHLKGDKKFLLFGIETVHSFEIKNFKKLFPLKNGKCVIPDSLMIPFINISISGTRGMLAVKNSIPEYAKHPLPIISPNNILMGLKKNVAG